MRVGDCRQQGDSDGAADLLGRVEQARRDAEVVVANPGKRGDREGHQGQAHSSGEKYEGGEKRAHEAAADARDRTRSAAAVTVMPASITGLAPARPTMRAATVEGP